MIFHFSPDITLYLFFSKDAKAQSKHLLKKSLNLYFEEQKIPPEEVVTLPSGKPAFVSGKHFLSVTHTESLYAICFSGREIGIDAERVTREKERVAEKYFTLDEKKLPFSYVWTAKEAVSKISGKGLSKISRIRVEKGAATLEGKTFSLISKKVRGYQITIAQP